MNPDIWIVTGISPDVRAQARKAADRSDMTAAQWIERAIRKTLFLDGADPENDRTIVANGNEREVIRALAALEDRLNRRPEWPAATPAASPSSVAKAPATPPSPPQQPPSQQPQANAPAAPIFPTPASAAPAPAAEPEPTEAPLAEAEDAPPEAEVPPMEAAAAAPLSAAPPFPAFTGEKPTSLTSRLPSLGEWEWDRERFGPTPWVIAMFAAIGLTAIAAVALVHWSISPSKQERLAGAPSPTVPKPKGAALERAAAAGDARAQARLGLLYATGGMGQLDGRRAAIWLHRAEAQGVPSASFLLGLIYDRGIGVPRAPRQALLHYRRAARENYAPAQHNLGVILAEGIGGKPDYVEARRWFQLAAEAGVAASQYSLGLMYERGLGIRRDLDRANALYRDAARNGNNRARERLRSLASDDATTIPAPTTLPRLGFDAAGAKSAG